MEFFSFQKACSKYVEVFLVRGMNIKARRIQSTFKIIVIILLVVPFANSGLQYASNLDFVRLFEVITILIGILMSMTGQFSLHFRYRSFEKFHESVLNLDSKMSSEDRISILRNTRFVQKVSKANICALQLGTIFAIYLPLLGPIYRVFVGEAVDQWPIPFQNIYPFNTNVSYRLLLI